jgi:hypothetical protein
MFIQVVSEGPQAVACWMDGWMDGWMDLLRLRHSVT